MIKLEALKLKDIMPANLIADSNVSACADSLDVQLQGLANNARLVLILYRLDELDDDMLDSLAWQYHVDTYDQSYDLETKRDLIRNSIHWHSKKGTPWAVQSAVSSVLGSAVVKENWEYSGEAYHFRVEGLSGKIQSAEIINTLVSLINKSKNTRSWLDGVYFAREIDSSMYIAGASDIFKATEISMQEFKMPDIDSASYIAGANSISREITIEEAE